jgi:hypothetical protein
MKHLERLKKIVNWAVKNEWIDKNPFAHFQLKFKRLERDYLTELELSAIETLELESPALQKSGIYLYSVVIPVWLTLI